ncbi:MAG: ABC transporter ATP-binding protein [Dysgonomonas mossii]|uniref:ABC transporter ATP-binding protein n=1 Tax=Dysgonomonas mossii TaxID=163665 RepID=UPI001D5FC8F8|nr:ABC transporter ATP-binding protein [Dysgonomonas mossii]MBS5796500.1 ABC transporter ATP-binding protein [Dysgonomonas mossii]MBS7111746.1 ABC transporter ATP-binding protein [Dysgonomonas mossii]
MDTIIQCDKITHYYGTKLIYQDLSFEVKKGKILGLLGKNGTGKTTIINILNGYLRPQAGVCRIFGEEMDHFTPQTKARIGLLLEGHIQHTYFNVVQIEKFYSSFFQNWNRDAYYELLKKLQVTKTQKISTMSCGQRSQVALGLLFAQNPDLLILDDFSMGLDPGYRRLFIEYLKEYATAEDKTIFLTSHIIQDMEMLIDDCIILDYGKILLHQPTSYIINKFKRYRFITKTEEIGVVDGLWNTEKIGSFWETYSFDGIEAVNQKLAPFAVTEVKEEALTLEDAFIGLTGKY